MVWFILAGEQKYLFRSISNANIEISRKAQTRLMLLFSISFLIHIMILRIILKFILIVYVNIILKSLRNPKFRPCLPHNIDRCNLLFYFIIFYPQTCFRGV